MKSEWTVKDMKSEWTVSGMGYQELLFNLWEAQGTNYMIIIR